MPLSAATSQGQAVFMYTGTSIQQRQEAIILKKYHPDWSFSKIGRKIGCSRSFVRRWVERDQAGEPQHDQPRTCRPAKFDFAVQKYIVKAAKLPDCRNATNIAAKLQQTRQLTLSASTVSRILRQSGLQYHKGPNAQRRWAQ